MFLHNILNLYSVFWAFRKVNSKTVLLGNLYILKMINFRMNGRMNSTNANISNTNIKNMTKVAFPYVSYRTFRNFLELLKEGLPSRIDRSVWGPRYSGTTGQQLMTALKSLLLISESGIPTTKLEALVNSNGTQRQLQVKAILENKYSEIFEIDLKRATRSQFNEAFRSVGINDGMLNKCQLFFIQACQDAGIELSSYILARRHGLSTTKKNEKSNNIKPLVQPKVKLSANEVIISKILEKYPDFDPNWKPEVQKSWMEGMIKLYDGIN